LGVEGQTFGIEFLQFIPKRLVVEEWAVGGFRESGEAFYNCGQRGV
jgi:hypothetical protein